MNEEQKCAALTDIRDGLIKIFTSVKADAPPANPYRKCGKYGYLNVRMRMFKAVIRDVLLGDDWMEVVMMY
eukprot:COSAG01_NODE_24440_length_778_cov_98.164948_1_plen_71_part_00